MSGGAAQDESAWTDALLAIALFAVDPGLGGICLRALPGPVRDRFIAAMRECLPTKAPARRLPLHAADDRLLGGLDLAATFRAGKPVASRGLLADTDGGVLIVAMAERVPVAVAARIGATLDTGEVVAERDGMALRNPARIGVVALDEGVTEDERPPAALLDRLAFHVALAGISMGEAAIAGIDRGEVAEAAALLRSVKVPDEILDALGATASALGVASMRALLFSVRAARAAAALAGRRVVMEADAMAAARLVFAPARPRYPFSSLSHSRKRRSRQRVM